ncbi:MAG: glycogen debranching protein GlgX [Phycisphaerae bacterium]|nr:glycogen debranching protein GlgX [Phycisphaerae bacterium]
MTTSISHGHSFPIGATVTDGGVNFSVFSKHAERMELLLFASADAPTPSETIVLDRSKNRTYHYWHVFLSGLRPGHHYAWRADGPRNPAQGLIFDGTKTLLDPYGRAVAFPKAFSRAAASLPGDNAATALRSVVVDASSYDWEGDEPPRTPFRRTVVYELHVRGFTKHQSSGVATSKAGTFAGLVEKIPYLKELGVTAVELMPVFAFDPQDAPTGRVNYWGYSPVSFFALHPFYASTPDPLSALDEFRDMVKAVHRAGIEVLLDVVYNHTAEGGTDGPMYSFRGFANRGYYLLDPKDRSQYRDYTGCGNTLRTNHPVVRRLILDSLKWWVEDMHVDGFRFDLASILSRDETGHPVENPPAVWDIESDPVLCNVKLIAEAWDAAGLYQVGSFVGDSWKEWNGRFRDDVRRFLHGEQSSVRSLPPRLVASPDIYASHDREPEQSVNFVTCHDGFTLNDLVSYAKKHNEENGEESKDGAEWNHSSNHGVEGPTTDPAIEALRHRQVKNFFALTLLSLGTPMIAMGDEARRTQRGNNNAWCQDNEISWFDWSLVKQHPDLLRFVRLLVRARATQPDEPNDDARLHEVLSRAELTWHGVRVGCPDWGDHSKSLALEARRADGIRLWLGMNAYEKALDFDLPQLPSGHHWHRRIDTSLASPADVEEGPVYPPIDGWRYRVGDRSVVLLLALVKRIRA